MVWRVFSCQPARYIVHPLRDVVCDSVCMHACMHACMRVPYIWMIVSSNDFMDKHYLRIVQLSDMTTDLFNKAGDVKKRSN